MAKPPGLNELVARVDSLLRRKRKNNLQEANLRLEIGNEGKEGGNGSNTMTPIEFRLASCLVINKGKLLEYSQLINEVWAGKEVSVDTLHFYIRGLRKKLQTLFPNRIDIIGRRGVGYRLEVKE
jgi:DNA-binding response OmpR family regulator